jgi:hypothetical protein
VVNPFGGAGISINPTSFTNNGTVQALNNTHGFVTATTWSNSAGAQLLADGSSSLGLGNFQTTAFSNAGTISATNQSQITFGESLQNPNPTHWSNTGTISSQDSNLTFDGLFSSAVG